MRRKLVEADLVECVLGLGSDLFYNSPMEACVVVCRSRKGPEQQGRILFIDAVNEVEREWAQSTLKTEHQRRILAAYQAFADEPGFARVATQEEIAWQEYRLSIPLYIKCGRNGCRSPMAKATAAWQPYRPSVSKMGTSSGWRWMNWSRCWMGWLAAKRVLCQAIDAECMQDLP